MTDKELKILTENFQEVKTLLDSHEKFRKEISKVRRRLISKIESYSFLKNIVTMVADDHGNKLVNAVVALFKDIGFSAIENVDKKGDEDIRLWTNNRLIIFEISGSENPSTSDDKAHQISKHIPKTQTSHPELIVSGVFIMNHEFKKHYTKRNKRPFQDKLIAIAKSHGYSLLTTVTLLELYLAVKADKLTPEDLVGLLCKGGEVKWSPE